MIIANELRIGNLIFVKQFGIDIPAKIETYHDLIQIDNETLQSEPIPLTEEWLLKFGFKKEYEYFIYPNFPVLGELCTEINMEYVFDTEKDELRIYYVHQLQNLYSALTGKELEVVNG